MIEIEPLTANIGAEVRGVDLQRPLPDDERDAVHEALLRHLVLFFRDQPLTEHQQRAFAATFGPPDGDFVHIEDDAERPPKSDRWHTDVPFSPSPPDIAVLTMPAPPPPVGGDTMWLSLYAVHDSLSPTMQQVLAGLEMVFDMGPSKLAAREMYGEEHYQQLLANEPTAQHPLVRTHPVTGRPAVYLGGAFMRGIAGMHQDESDAIVSLLQSKLDDPNIQVRWRWRQHDVVVWDERCTNHRGLSDHYPHHRLVRRITVGAGVPAVA